MEVKGLSCVKPVSQMMIPRYQVVEEKTRREGEGVTTDRGKLCNCPVVTGSLGNQSRPSVISHNLCVSGY